MSVEKLKSQDAYAAELLRILAFFANESIYYDLLSADEEDPWPGLGNIMQTKATFERSMARLRDYSLVETSRRCYRLHPCVHDWTLSSLNQHVEESDIWRAMTCVVAAGRIAYEIWETDDGDPQSRLASHAMRLMHPRLYDVLENSELDEERCNLLCGLGGVLAHAGMAEEATPLLGRSLAWSHQHLGEEHHVSLNTSNVVGLAQQELQNFSQAENLMKQAIHGLRELWASMTKPPWTQSITLHCFIRKRFDEAEDLYLWSLRGCEESYGPLDVNTFWAMLALAEFYATKDEPGEVEKFLHQILKGFEAAADSDHPMSRAAASRLGAIYEQKGNHHSAAAMFQRVYDSCGRVHGPEHWSTLEAQENLTQLEAKSR
ncbi:uncharacterized protein A1O9_01993 [Exophiala aquamarina CBS 119918]|uniref:MalT-like TPR region domain-containing protein n=1 Tax=Exophiala aquamarina CBS 119918 TaxID=1182545 RepID=A0A072PL09_9EURO|nr:uncharacterized protein A1O9_01993 [Exophiala aquamarina CBS 119918]KEF60432.1 hypothetical protein A1O9_01993 [Exophiala aquamarina CBS 119918]